MDWTLSTLPRHFRQIALWLVITLTIGYTTGLIFAFNTTMLTPRGVRERYRGNQADSAAVTVGASQNAAPEQEMKFEKSYPEMLNLTHTHVLGMATFFGLA